MTVPELASPDEPAPASSEAAANLPLTEGNGSDNPSPPRGRTTPAGYAADTASAPKLSTPRAAWDRVALRVRPHAAKLSGLWSLMVGALFFFGVNRFTRFKDAIEFDPDEGNNVIKALLLDRGYRFDDIWSDQPPLFAHLLRGLFNLTGWKTEHARMLVLLFAAIVVTVIYDLLRRQYSHWIALTGVGLLLATKSYVPLSVSVMIGLPSIAFCCIGVWALALWRDDQRPWLLALSGATFGLSVGTKMFTAFLPPVFGLVLLAWSWEVRGRNWRRLAVDVGLWSGVFLAVLVACLMPVLRSKDPFSIYRAHDIARTTDAIGGFLGDAMVVQFLEQDVAVFALAAAGLFVALSRRVAASSLMGLWLVVAGGALYRHTPVWEHHRLLITIPAAYLAAVAIGELGLAFRASTPLARRRLALPPAVLGPIVLTTLLFASPERVKDMKMPPGWSADEDDGELLEKLMPYRSRTKYMLTARQMYAFRLGLEVPPSLAVTSLKRFRTGLLNSDTIIETLNKYDPGIVVITTRWSKPVRNKVRRALEQDYVRIYEDRKNHSLEAFVRREIANPRDVLQDG